MQPSRGALIKGCTEDVTLRYECSPVTYAGVTYTCCVFSEHLFTRTAMEGGCF